jgi:hypothetical protein
MCGGMKTEKGGTVEEKKGRDMLLQTEGIPETGNGQQT